MKLWCALALTLAHPHAAAQSSTTSMPEGTTDVAVSVLLGSIPKAEGNTRRTLILVPNFWVQWSNGVFLEGLNLGMQLSSDPLLQYGPLLSLGLGSTRADMTGERPKKRLVPGAFVRFYPIYNVRIESTLENGSSPDGSGVLLETRISYRLNIAARQSVALAAGVSVGSGDYMQSTFGISREQAARTGLAVHEASGGIKSVFAGARWNWQFSRKYTLGTSVTFSQLRGSAAASPITSNPSGVSYLTSLTYQF